jgi:hypothetical protein
MKERQEASPQLPVDVLSFLQPLSGVIQLSPSLESAQALWVASQADDRKAILENLTSLQISIDNYQVKLSVAGLSQRGFDVVIEEGRVSLSLSGGNEFSFSNIQEANQKQLEHKGYISDKPVVLKELGEHIDPYRLIDFIEWLTIQQTCFISLLPQDELVKDLHTKTTESLYFFEGAVHVFMERVIVGTAGRFETWGLGPCVGLVIVNKNKKVGLLAHVTSMNPDKESIELISELLQKEGTDLSECGFVICGGEDRDKAGILPQAITISTLLQNAGCQLLNDFSGQGASRLTLDLNEMQVELELSSQEFGDSLQVISL